MIRWMCGVSMKDRRTSKELRELVGVEPITTVIESGRLRSYEHVMRKSDEDWVKKSMEYRVESRRPVLWKRMLKPCTSLSSKYFIHSTYCCRLNNFVKLSRYIDIL